MTLAMLMNLGFAGGAGAVVYPADFGDLTWLWTQSYLPALNVATPAEDDNTTLVAQDESTVRASTEGLLEADDANTRYARYIEATY